ncbi:HAD family hydrolase [Brucella anthropi]|uniref:HAD family hydrolase n=1 Tax=Brucella anthropi TaxID=529 RepID=UPI000E0189A7|nr:HAD family hydrolase [Brucella anthropi]SUB55973.1 Zinc-transporting ATPase [Brucella anthropi]
MKSPIEKLERPLVAVAIDARIAGYIIMADPLRGEVVDTLRGLRKDGVKRIVLATGDRTAVAKRIAKGLGSMPSTRSFRPIKRC